MQRIFLSGLLTLFMLLHTPTRAQSLESFLADPAFTPASIGICITDVATGETLVSHNDRQAIIPASTVKVITSATALRLLGSDYRTSTTVGYTGQIDSAGTLHGTLVIRGGGDPSLGSAYGSRPADEFVDRVIDALQTHRIRAIEGTIVVDNSLFDGPAVSPKWMLEDLIWYYATGCHAFSYRDNQVRVEVRYNGHNYKTARITPPHSIDLDSPAPARRPGRGIGHPHRQPLHPHRHHSPSVGALSARPGRRPSRQPVPARIARTVETGRHCLYRSRPNDRGRPRNPTARLPLGVARPAGAQPERAQRQPLCREPAAAHRPRRGSPGQCRERSRNDTPLLATPREPTRLELFLYDGSGTGPQQPGRRPATWPGCSTAAARDPQVRATPSCRSLPRAGTGRVGSLVHAQQPPARRTAAEERQHERCPRLCRLLHRPFGQAVYTIVLMFNNYTCTRDPVEGENCRLAHYATLSKKR